MAVKVCYIISDVSKALAFEWIHKTIDRNKVDLRFILIGPIQSPLISFLANNDTVCYPLVFRGKGDLIKTWLAVFSILRKEKPAAVHTHLYYASLIGLTAAWVLGITKRIHTRHHGSLHHRYFPRAVYFDKLINAVSTNIIVLCSKQRQIVSEWENAAAEKIHLIPHGFDLPYFEQIPKENVDAVRERWRIPMGFPVIGVISRFTEWKGVQYIIPAFKQLLQTQPAAHLLLANAQGDYAAEIKKLLSGLPAGSYTEVPFEEDLASLYGLFDLFVHAPVDEFAEAFGQTYVEALAAGVPSIFTLSGIACDFVVHNENAWIVSHRNPGEITMAMERLLADESSRSRLQENGHESAQLFGIREMVDKLEALYLS